MMKVVAALCFAAAVAAVRDLPREHSPEFISFASQYEKSYCNGEAMPCAESLMREGIFQANLKFIEEHNARNDVSFTVGVNKFADLTSKEFAAIYNGFNYDASANRAETPFSHSNVEAASSVDWRTKGAVTHVKNQAQCGSCWAFSAVGAVEGITKIATGELNVKVGFSEQELVSCDKGGTDMGCEGGLMDSAFEFVMKNGLAGEKAYPYTASDAPCDTKAEKKAKASIDGYEDVPTMDEDSLRKAVTMQPVSVAIEADQSSFQLYKDGVFDDPSCGTLLDHGVLVVGYDSSDGYYIVKNSWGADWGMDGYIMMAMDKNQCGIAMQPSYPTKKSESDIQAAM